MNPQSPMSLAMRPKKAKGVKRLNRMPIYIGTGAGCLVICIVVYTYHQRMQRQTEQAAAADSGQAQGAGAHAKDFFTPAAERQAPASRQQEAAARTEPATRQGAQTQAADPAEDARKKLWAQYYQQLAAVQQAKDEAAAKAMAAGTNANDGGPGGLPGTQAGALGGAAPAAQRPGELPVAGVDGGAQAEKRAFLAQGGDPLGLNEDLMAGLHGPKLNTIMQGTAIPGIMVGGLTSDMPGMVVGSVGENVYDTAGLSVDPLIPQGSRVVGSYDNSVSNGQERIGVIWQRIIFPDTSSIQLGSMEGADQGGHAGFHDQVDTHFWDKFLSATIISIAGAAAQVAQPQQSAFSGYSPSSVASGQLTQGYSQLGQEYARAGLSIPNTLSIRPGYRFTLMVNRDVHLPPYVDRRTAAARPTGAIYQ